MVNKYSEGDKVLVTDRLLAKQIGTNPISATIITKEHGNYLIRTEIHGINWWVSEDQLKPSVYSDGLDNWE